MTLFSMIFMSNSLHVGVTTLPDYFILFLPTVRWVLLDPFFYERKLQWKLP